MDIEYVIKSVDYDSGLVEVSFTLDDGSIETVYIETMSIAVTEDESELSLKISLDQLVQAHYQMIFPAPKIRPENLSNMIGKVFTVTV